MKTYESASAFFSLLMHSLIILSLMFIASLPKQIEIKTETIEVGFGEGSGAGGGGYGNEIKPGEESIPPAEAVKHETKSEDLPIAKPNEDAIAVKKNNSTADNSPKNSNTTVDNKGSGIGTGNGTSIGPGNGNGLGYSIDWGGGGSRKIYQYPLPVYPPGANKQLDVKIKFFILIDGTVGRKILLTKGDAKLENAALEAIQRWRFEPIKTQQGSAEQQATILFQFRLR